MSVINGKKEFGITVHYIDEGIDTGDTIFQEIYPITDIDNYAILVERAYVGCVDVFNRSIKLIQTGSAKRVKQDMIDEVGMYYGMKQERMRYYNIHPNYALYLVYHKIINRPNIYICVILILSRRKGYQ